MKKYFLFFVSICCMFPVPVFAGATTVDSNAIVTVTIDQSDRSSDSYDYGSREFTFPYLGRMDSSSTFAPQPIYNLEKLGDMKGLPEDWAKMGWRIRQFPNRLVSEGIPLEVLDETRAPWLSDRETKTGWPVIEKANGRVYPINFFPKDGSALPVMHAKAYAQDEKYLPVEAENEAIYHGSESGAKFFVELYNIHNVSKAKNFSLGTTIVGNAAVGPGDQPGKRLLSGGGGSGWGTAQSWVWERGGYWVIFFNKRPLPPAGATVKKTAAPKAKPSTALAKAKVQKKKIPSVMFDQDSARIYRPDQFAALDAISAAIAKMKPMLVKNGEAILIVGGASQEASYDYNLILSDKRAEVVSIAIGQRLKKIHNISAKTVKSIVQYVAISEKYPDYDKKFPDSRNRRCYLLRTVRISE